MPTEQESYDFFTRQWEPEREDEVPELVKPEEAEEGTAEEDEEEEEDGDNKKKKKKDKKEKKKKGKQDEEEPLLDIDAEEDSWKYYQVNRALYEPFHDRITKEDEVLFSPRIRAAKLEDRLVEGTAPRYLEEEGFYVGTRPAVAPTNLHRMENRLLEEPGEEAKDWFGEDGVLIALPNPLKEYAERPPIVEEVAPLLQTEYKKAFLIELDGRCIDPAAEGSVGHYQLDVDVNSLFFTHHHLFSREHVLASRITNQYQQYLSRCKRQAAELLTEKLKALKAATLHVQENIAAMEGDKNCRVGFETQQKRLQEYNEEIKLTRKLRDAELAADRALLKHIIQTWKEIKSLRQFQNFTNTPVKLVIKKEPTDKAKEDEEWEAEIEEEMEEMRLESQIEYTTLLQTYHTDLEAWKKQKLEKALKRSKKRGRRQSQGTDKDQDLLDEEDIPKPEKPKAFNDVELRTQVFDKYSQIKRKPGEPKIHFELSNGASITPTNSCPKGEQSRRNEVNRYKVFVKVLFNGKEVSRTSPKPLGQDFAVNFAQIFNIEIMRWPESIKMEIYEAAGLSVTLLSEVYAAIPPSNLTVDNVQLDVLDFSSDQRLSHSHEGVGSNVAFSFDKENAHIFSLLTSGQLSCVAAWAVNEEGGALVPPSLIPNTVTARRRMDPVAALGVAGMSDMDKLSKWIAESRLDPNDPTNADLMFHMKPIIGGDTLVPTHHMPVHFHLEQMQEEFNFATDQEMEKSRRFRMLQLRQQEAAEFKNKIVPALEKEIPEDIFLEYEKKKRDVEKLKSMDEAESHRVAVAKFMQRVREQVMLRFRIASHQKTLPEVVFEDAVPNIGTIIPNLLKITEPRRPLKPIRKERKKVTAQNLQTMDVKILINIVRAFGIPVRSDQPSVHEFHFSRASNAPGGTQNMEGTASARPPGIPKSMAAQTQVRPFIEVTFQRSTVATTIAEGPNPSWNEELTIPFKPPNNDYSATNLQTIRDVVFFNLFDEYVTEIVQDDRERGTTVVRKIEKKWLGTIKIPFSTIYFNSRIDGTFRLNKPPVLLGYQHEAKARKQTPGQLGEEPLDMAVGSSDNTFLTMFVTIEPALTPAEPAKEKFDSNEDEKLLEVSEKWQSEIASRFPTRECKTTVVDINGKSVFITRYFKSLKPPEELFSGEESGNEKVELVARYVSMIPFVSDSVVFPGLCDIWSTCDQFLQMLQGDEEEHAVLLTNYFLSMGKTAFLLLGSAIPEGPTAYVLTKEERDYWVWNASTGEHYSFRDNFCPVQSVGCLVNADNIWANIQPNDQPSRITFDLSNTSNWRPFFHKGCPNPGLSSVQPENLIYFTTEKSSVIDIQERIERQLKEKIMEWRPRYITRWNRYCMQTFRRLLTKLEISRHNQGTQQQHSSELDQILGQYKMCGFPINLPYTEMDPIIDAVYATGVHNIETSDVEFALAVHVHPYPNSVLSVWIYVASLSRKR
uniref:C2 domain-containing protein n=1 Tax=Capitella teleta TaxID=283909 RepID=X1Z7B6_CAPTE